MKIKVHRVLYVVHAGFWEEFSGTPLIAKQYIELALARGWEVGLLLPATPPFGQARAPTQDLSQKMAILRWPAQQMWALEAFQTPPAQHAESYDIASLFRPDIVHILDWVGIHSSVLLAIHKLQVPVIRHVWNMEDICARVAPIAFLPDRCTCKAPVPAGQCAQCVVKSLVFKIDMPQATFGEAKARITDLENRVIAEYSHHIDRKWTSMREQMAYYDHLVFPCTSFADYFGTFLKFQQPTSIIIHGVAPPSLASRHDKGKSDLLNCVFLGGASEAKGLNYIEEAFLRLGEVAVSGIALKVCGLYSDTLKERLAAYRNVEILGPISPDELKAVLAWADVGIAPSNFETFCRVVREFMLNGVVPVASYAFGIPDIVIHGKNGILLERPYGASLADALLKLQLNPGLLEELRQGALRTKVNTASEEFDQLESLYFSLMKRPVPSISTKQTEC